MGRIINTTNIRDTRYLLSQTPTNKRPSNYWLKELQDKINADWDLRPNRADIQQEEQFGIEKYSPLQVVVQSVKNDKGAAVSDDWRRLVFKNINYHPRIGQRYKFNINLYSEPEDNLDNIWIGVNQDALSPTASQVVIRCNGTLGSIVTNDKGDKIYHYEPVVQKEALQGVSLNFNEVAVENKGNLTIIAQHNQYTANYYVNQRFVIGYDQIYKIKNIIKTGALSTYDPRNVGVMTIYLEIDQRGEQDDFEHRIAYNGQTDEIVNPEPKPSGDCVLQVTASEEPFPTALYSTPIFFFPKLIQGEKEIPASIEVSAEVENSTKPEAYYELQYKAEDNSFSLRRKKYCAVGDLIVTCLVKAQDSPTNQNITTSFTMDLGGME